MKSIKRTKREQELFDQQVEYLQMINKIRRDRAIRLRQDPSNMPQYLPSSPDVTGLHNFRNTDPY